MIILAHHNKKPDRCRYRTRCAEAFRPLGHDGDDSDAHAVFNNAHLEIQSAGIRLVTIIARDVTPQTLM